MKARSLVLAAAVATAVGASASVAEAQQVDCSTLPNPIYVQGSSAARPFIAALANSLYSQSVTIISADTGGSCDGVNAMVNDKRISPGTGTYYPGNTDDAGAPVATKCNIVAADGGSTGPAVDIGFSDVWADSCPNVTPDYSKVGDFYGPNQVMTFVVPQKAMSYANISAEAAYFVMGKAAGAKILDPWKDAEKLVIRNASSGTQTMLGKAIRLEASLWKGWANGATASSSSVINALSAANAGASPDNYIGILATTEADANRNNIKVLAFQELGKKCAYWPDTSLTSFDKANVRNGNYAVFGPLHMLTKVSSMGGDPSNPFVKQIINYLTGKSDPPGGKTQLIDLMIKNYDVPQCAMRVKRTTEMGPISPYTPDVPCHCYFEQKATGIPSSCKTCSSDGDCGGGNMVCGYGYCEAK